MREIKFRGKRVDNGEWVYGDIIHCTSGKTYIFPSGDYANESDKVNQEGCLMMFTFEVAPKTAGQFTGLRDKKGKEIYDGDIVKCVSELYSGFGKYPTGKFSTTYYEICSINKNAYCFGERRIGGKNIFEGILRDCAKEYYEVIGNIYENPELLEENNG